eukprot:1162110-Pelagomonas_calceolata.AAC.3
MQYFALNTSPKTLKPLTKIYLVLLQTPDRNRHAFAVSSFQSKFLGQIAPTGTTAQPSYNSQGLSEIMREILEHLSTTLTVNVP